MIELYSWPTPNGWKVHIMLEELGLNYRVHPIDIGAGDQFAPEFLKISPNNKIPAIIDTEGPGGTPISLFESGAILVYLAEKSGRFLPTDARGRYEVMQWLMFQMGGLGPMLGQAHHFRVYAPEKISYAIDRYTDEATRLYEVVNRRLGEAAFLAAGEYTIADMAVYAWIRPHERQGQNLDDYPHLKNWFNRIDARPAVQKGIAVLAEKRKDPSTMTAEQRNNMFGKARAEKN